MERLEILDIHPPSTLFFFSIMVGVNKICKKGWLATSEFGHTF